MSIEVLLEKVTTDPTFSDQLKADPETALPSVGVEPTPDLLAAINETAIGEELSARISKAYKSGR